MMLQANPAVYVRGAVLRERRILLVREKGGGRAWSLPGGEADPERTHREFLAEKILRDTGIQVNVTRVIHASDEHRSESGSRSIHITYLCVPVSGKLTPGGGAKEARWVDIDSVDRIPLSDLTREAVDILRRKFTLVIRNRDVRRILIGVPKGHTHRRVIIELNDGLIVLQEATVENLVRAFVGVEMHPYRRAAILEGRTIGRRKEGYSSYQLLELDIDDSEVERIVTEMLGIDTGEGDQDLKGAP